jgi:tRNA-splicing ligase RtcB
MINLPDQDLAYLPEGSEYYADYVFAVSTGRSATRASTARS